MSAVCLTCIPFGCPQVYPDVGVAAMLKNQWTDATFGFASLNDRCVPGQACAAHQSPCSNGLPITRL